eukprot:2789154-Amphidinium_carterae.4
MTSTGEKRQKWIDSIKKELASFKNNHATEIISPDLKQWELPVADADGLCGEARHGSGSEEHQRTTCTSD